VENPGGIFAGSRLTALAVLALTLGGGSAVEQARFTTKEKQIRAYKNFLSIKSKPRKVINLK